MRKLLSHPLTNRARRIIKANVVVVAENLPVLYFVAPRLYMGVDTRVGGLSPSILRPQLLWNVDQMTVKGSR